MIVALLALAVVQAPGGEDAAPPVVNVEWVRAPSGNDIVNAYPELAWDRGKSGRATLSCVANDAGLLGSCSVVAEKPKGFGFGKAALRLAPKFQLAPASYGQRMAGGHIQFAIDFKMPATK
ncbi:MAG TPA: TonB family protein [Caulobacteraceae bacterium]|jgi:protein TonB|nr:TonB family protein [Caulobacteraceae bacterium]